MTRLMETKADLLSRVRHRNRQSWEEAIDSVVEAGGKPYPIPAGASVHKYGGLGYVGFAEEVLTQEAEMGFAFDYIVVCSVTGSTQAGMIVGFAKHNRAHTVIGIDGSCTAAVLRTQMKQIIENTSELVELERKIEDREIVINPDYAYPAYGVPSEETNEAIRLAARTGAKSRSGCEGNQGLIIWREEFLKARKFFCAFGGTPAQWLRYTYRNG